MAFEMICGQCRGNLLVEHFGVVVACPHCGAHLHVPDPAETAPPEPTPITTEPPPPQPSIVAEPPASPVVVQSPVVPAPAPSIAAPPSASGINAANEPTVPEVAPPQPVPVSQIAATGAAQPIDATVPAASVAPPPASASVLDTEPAVAQASNAVSSGLSDLFGSSASTPTSSAPAHLTVQPTAVADAIPESDPPFDGNMESSQDAIPVQSVASTPRAVPPTSPDRVSVSKTMFVFLISYASALTLGFGWLLYQMKTGGGSGGLEALPDPVPAKKTGFLWYPPRTPMTAGHNLEIGDSQRFGNIKVTVLRVTRGPIKFRHFSNANESRRPTFPVLKLWLRLENVSDDQEIAPLDDQLLFRRSGNNYTEYKSSQFVCRLDEKRKTKPKIVIAYDHKVGSGWDLVNLPLEKPLAPHESRDYYVPTCEQGLDDLVGSLVWRVHIRKGYSARGNGVTTLFEVHFNSDEIGDDNA